MKQELEQGISIRGLRCSRCLGELTVGVEAVLCSSCCSRYQSRNGIIDVSIEPGYYYGEIARETMATLAERSEDLGWQPALAEFLAGFNPKERDYHRRYALLETRAAWKYLLHIPSNESVALDLGCGWGSTAISLAKTYEKVVAMDMTTERLRFLKTRSEKMGFTNIHFLRGGDGVRLPFADNTFDSVILNGVLEWVPWGKIGKPRALQIMFLQEICRVLKSDGQVYIGIENRIGYKYFLGEPEDHTGFRFVSLFPRRLADFYLRLRGKGTYRNYTYTLAGMRKLLADGGFVNGDAYIPVKDYRDFKSLIKADGEWGNPCMIVNSAKRWLWARVQTTRVYRYFCPSLSMVGRKGGPVPSLLDQICSDILRRLPAVSSDRWVIRRYLVSEENVVIVEADIGGTEVIIKIPLTNEAHENLRRNQEALELLSEKLGGQIRDIVPKFILRIDRGPTSGFVESRLRGNSAQKFLLRTSVVERISNQAIKLILEVHNCKPWKVSKKPGIVQDVYGAAVERLQVYMRLENKEDDFNVVKDFVINAIEKKAPPLLLSHGDFWLGNVLVNHDMAVTGIIDWGSFVSDGLPLLDLCELLLEGEHLRSGRRLDEVYSAYLSNSEFPCQEELDSYLRRFSLGREDIGAYLILHWIIRCGNRLNAWRNELDQRIIQEQVLDVFPIVLKYARASIT